MVFVGEDQETRERFGTGSTMCYFLSIPYASTDSEFLI